MAEHVCGLPAEALRGQQWVCPSCGQVWLRVDTDELDALTVWRRDE